MANLIYSIVAALTTGNGEIIGNLVANAKQFKTGSRGFYGNSKIVIDGKRYQASVMLVEIGSKENAGEFSGAKVERDQPTPTGTPKAEWTPPQLPAPNAEGKQVDAISFASAENAKAETQGVKIRRGK